MITPGTRIGGLLIEELLGRGAMGEVYRAVQVSLKRPVAVKRIAGHLVDNPDMVARFEREAQCIARIQSTNVVGVYEFGQYGDAQGEKHFLLVMELVEGGRSLKSYMSGAMDWRLASSVVLQAAEGLAAANEQGVVHRDIKPDNIMVTRKGVAKLTDFGLAKAVDSTAMTMGGTLLGTPAYMPPEACRGEATDHRGDLYSLGATWFHLLSGQPPFRSDNTMAMLRAHIEEPPPNIITLFPTVPEPIADLVRRCLAKRPEDRPVSAQQLANELMALVAQGIHLQRSVPELVGNVRGAASDPSTIATMVSGGNQAASAAPSGTAVTMMPAQAGVEQRKASAGANPATRNESPTVATAMASPARRSAGWLVGVAVAVVAIAIGLAFALGPGAKTSVAPSTPNSPAEVKTVPPPTPVTVAPTPTPSLAPGGDHRAPPLPVVTSPPVAVAPDPAPAPLTAPAAPNPTANPSAAPVAVIAPAPAPALAAPAAPAAVYPAPAKLVPPTLVLPEPAKPPTTAAANPDSVVAAFRDALRKKQVGRAESLLSSLPGDASGYKDMVRNLTALKNEQSAVFAALERAVSGSRFAEIDGAADRSAIFPDLALAVGQARTFARAAEQQWLDALRAVDDALAAKDLPLAKSALATVPSDPEVITPAFADRRRAAAAACAAADVGH